MSKINRDSSQGFIFKLVLIGAGAVGKTSLVQRFVNNTFKTNYTMTMGVDFMVKNVDFEVDKFAKLAIWDIGGQDRFQFLRNTFSLLTGSRSSK